MGYFYTALISLVIGFAGGWAFYKHRAEIKQDSLKKASDIMRKF